MPLLRCAADPVVIFSLDNASRAYWGGYGVAKAGLEGFLHILADEYHLGSAQPLRVFGIDTGPVMTGGRHRHYPGEEPGLHPTPDHVIGPYLYALGSESVRQTGVVLRRRVEVDS
jgi:NAD(P)-dependent dehydrogenase (short-subunit alcohol dehydrogenase family)